MEILSGIGKILIGLFGLGIMIFIHELGHLVAAKSLGIKVETFSLGYGRKLIGFKKGETTYQIAWFPIGGFCKMKGEHMFAKAVQENLARMPEDPDNYYNTRPWKRILVSIAGPVFNLVFAILFFTILYWAGFTEYSYDNRIILASEYNLSGKDEAAWPADQAGLLTGDRVVAINGKEIRTYANMRRATAIAPGEQLVFTVLRDGLKINRTVTPVLNTETAMGMIGVRPYAPLVIADLTKDMQLANPWLEKGDTIISIAGNPVANEIELFHAFGTKPASLPAVVQRRGQSVSHDLAMLYDKDSNPRIELMFQLSSFHTPQKNLFQAIGTGLDEVWYTIYSTFKFFSLIPQKINVGNALGGPIKTTYLLGEYTGEGLNRGLEQSIVQFVQFLCWLSVILGIMNLLPLPMLDGGFMVIFFIEWIRRKPFRPRFLYIYQMVGLAILAPLLIFIVFNDIFWLAKL